MKKKIAVFSSAKPDLSEDLRILGENIGKYLAEKEVCVITGGCLGVPGAIIQSAKKHGADTMAYFPDHDNHSHSRRYDNLGIEFFDTYKFIPGFTKRSVEMIYNVDAALVLNGRMGTLSEFSVAVEEGVPLGIILGTGGITDHLEDIVEISQKQIQTPVIFGQDYKEVIDKLLEAIS